MTNANLNKLTIKKALQGLKEKKFSCVELLNSCFKQIEKHDNKIKAFITTCPKEALEKAKNIDRLIKKDKDIFNKNPLLGIPYSAKDVFCTKGVRTTASSRVLKDYVPQYNATVINKLNNAGAILIGKTNCDPFGFGSSTENSGFQITRNPWDLSKVPGGSSGGSAAAVISNMGLFSLAEDTGGSIRQPACFCSVSGMKVTYGRVSRYGVIAYGSSLDTIGPMTKNVEDLSLVLKVIAGKDPKDATTLEKPVPNYLNSLKNNIKELTIGLPEEYYDKGINKKVKDVVLNASQELKKAGCKIIRVSLPHTKYAVPAYYMAGMSEVSANLARYDGIRYGQTRNSFEPEVKRRIMLGTYALSAGYYEAFYQKAMKVRTLIRQDFDNVFKNVDLLLTPVSPTPPFNIGEKVDNPLAMWMADIYTVTINPAGVPALAIPCGFTNKNLPIGMQLIGPQFSEDLLFNVGYAYQQVTDWHLKKPKL
ncbi:Asp-tRNA(Asn)/Glu-tRNA(Gln) amidotransferase subunit GatA [Patescibacteria group bacterium]